MLGAMRSTTWISTACCAAMLTDLRTARSAQSALRPRVSARERISATASLVTFSPTVPPVEVIGWAAPTLVLGAIAATGQPMRMKVTADAARDPGGPTQHTTGTGDAWID